MRYEAYVGRYVLYTVACSKHLLDIPNKKELIPKEIRKQAGRITNHLLYSSVIDESDKETVDIDFLRRFCCVQRPQGTYIDTHIEKNYWTYLRKMVLMNRVIEEGFQNIQNKKLLSPLCLCSSMIPSFIRIDTSGICQLLMTQERIKDFVRTYELLYDIKLNCEDKGTIANSFSKLSGKTDVSDNENAIHATRIWMYLCNFDNKKYKDILKNNRKKETWVFDNMILTDGCTINFQVTPLDCFKRSTFGERNRRQSDKTFEFPHVNDTDCIFDENVKYLSVDPGKGCLVMISDGFNKVRYTSYERDVATYKNVRIKTSLKIRKNEKLCISRKSVHDFETQELAMFSKKSCVAKTFAKHLEKRKEYETMAKKVYEHPFFCQSKFLVYCKRKSSEQKFVNKIKDVFDNHESKDHSWMNNSKETLSTIFRNKEKKHVIHLLYGDWGKNPNLKNSRPTPGIALRRRIHKNFKTITVSEHNTSKTCPCCGIVGNLEKATIESERPVKKSYVPEKHHLLRCKNEACRCRWWNRDVAGAFNILKKGLDILSSKSYPAKDSGQAD